MKKLVTILAAVSILCIPIGVEAVDYGGVGGNPANPDPSNPRTQSIFVYGLKPGEQKSDGVKVVNNTDQQKTIAVYAVDSQVSSGGALACAQAVDAKKDVGAWVTLAKNEVTLDAYQSEVVPFEIKVPLTADVGEHNGCVVIQDGSAQEAAGNGVSLSFRSALRMVITIPGDITKKLSFAGTSHSTGKDGMPIVKLAVKNEGQVSVDANITASIKNAFGMTNSKDGGSYPVLPRTTAEWTFELKRPFWGGLYTASGTAEYDGDPSKPLGVTSDSPKTVIAGKKIYFWVTPRPAALLIELAVIALLAGLGYQLYRRRQHQQIITTEWVTYKAKARDTIKTLAEKHDISWQKLAKANHIKPPYLLEKGQEIRVPKKES